MTIETLGIDIAKNVFQLHGVNRGGRVVFKRRVMRDQLLEVVFSARPLHDSGRSLHGCFLLGAQVRGTWPSPEGRQPAICQAVCATATE